MHLTFDDLTRYYDELANEHKKIQVRHSKLIDALEKIKKLKNENNIYIVNENSEKEYWIFYQSVESIIEDAIEKDWELSEKK